MDTRARESDALNLMCVSFNQAANQVTFLEDPEAYFERYALALEQRDALRGRDALRLVRLGGNVYLLAKFADILGIRVQELECAAEGQDAVALWHDLVLLLEGKAARPGSA